VVEVSDNGKGFDVQAARASSHGLAGMQHRVETAKGKLTISSAPGQGTRLSASLPTAAAAAISSPASQVA
jgi:signal transduction histidine kinase